MSLDKYVAQFKPGAFSWEHANCCHFVAGWVRACTGVDPMDGLPTTLTLRDTRELIQKLGATFADAVSQRLGEPIPVAFAQVGDVVLFEVGDRVAVGICAGLTLHHITTTGAVANDVPMSAATHAWRLRTKK